MIHCVYYLVGSRTMDIKKEQRTPSSSYDNFPTKASDVEILIYTGQLFILTAVFLLAITQKLRANQLKHAEQQLQESQQSSIASTLSIVIFVFIFISLTIFVVLSSVSQTNPFVADPLTNFMFSSFITFHCITIPINYLTAKRATTNTATKMDKNIAFFTTVMSLGSWLVYVLPNFGILFNGNCEDYYRSSGNMNPYNFSTISSSYCGSIRTIAAFSVLIQTCTVIVGLFIQFERYDDNNNNNNNQQSSSITLVSVLSKVSMVSFLIWGIVVAIIVCRSNFAFTYQGSYIYGIMISNEFDYTIAKTAVYLFILIVTAVM